MREIRGWQIGEVVTASDMTLDSANMYEQTGANGEANLPCIYNGLTLQSQSGTGNSIVTFNPGVCRCQDLPTSTYTYLPPNSYGTSYPCFIDISLADSNTVITLVTSPTTGYIVATFAISPNTPDSTDYGITGSLLQIATGSYNPAIHVRLCAYTYAVSTFTLDFTPGVSRDTDHTGLGGIQWNYQNSSLELNTPASQSGTSIVAKQNFTAQQNMTVQGTEIIQSGNPLQFYNTGNTFYSGFKAGSLSSSTTWTLPIVDGTPGQALITNGSTALSFGSASIVANIAANDSNVVFTSASNPYQVCTPTAARTYTMPSVFTAGTPWTFYNQSTVGANIITLQTSGANIIDYVLPVGNITLIPLTSTPTTAADWLVITANSNWISYTPILGAGWGTVSNMVAFIRRERKQMLVKFSWTNGTVSSSSSAIGLYNSFNIDTNFMTLNITTASQCESVGSVYSDGASHWGNCLGATLTDTTSVFIGQPYTAVNYSTGNSGVNSTFGSETVNGTFTVPIAEWS